MANEEQPVAKRMRFDGGAGTRRSLLLEAATFLLDTEEDDFETLLLLGMLKRKSARTNLLLHELLTVERDAEESEESDDESEEVSEDDGYEEVEVKKDFLEDFVSKYTDEQFLTMFRIGRSLYDQLCKSYAASTWFTKQTLAKRISSEKQIAVFLWFAAQVETTFDSAAQRFDLSKTEASNIIENTTMYLSSLVTETIKWPDDDKKLETSKDFAYLGFDKAIGSIGYTYITTPPPLDERYDYIDRHGNFSVCVQGVCNADRQFINLHVAHRGSIHPSWSYLHTPLCRELHTLCGEYYLLGKPCYWGTSNILVQYPNEHKFESKKGTFNRYLQEGNWLIDQTFSLLKQRFGKLQYCRLRDFNKISHFIRACCVIHNMAGTDDLPLEVRDEEIISMPEEGKELTENELKTNALREQLAEKMWEESDYFEEEA